MLASARKHGIADDDMLHAYRHPIQIYEFDELTMRIGADSAGRCWRSDWRLVKALSSLSMPWPLARSS